MYFTDDSLLPENQAPAHDHCRPLRAGLDAAGLHP